MGSPESELERQTRESRHRVRITRAYRMGATTVTREQHRLFDEGHECPGGDRHPVTRVQWYQAILFARWLGWALGGEEPGALPTEAQWEHACRAGTESVYWSGNSEKDLARIGWYTKNCGQVQQVAQKPASPWGLFDVHGNVWEWCADGVRTYPEKGELVEDPVDPSAPVRVMRGGSYWFPAVGCRSAQRGWFHAGNRSRGRGFRVVLPAASRSGIES